jgi:hypothetical protein
LRLASTSQKLARPGLPETSQPRPKSGRVISDTVSGAARWPLPLCCRCFDESKQNGGRAPSSETLTGSRGPSTPSDPKVGRRVWTPLVGFIKDRPSTDMSIECPLPAGSEEPAFGPELPHSERVPSLPFLTTTTAYSTRHRAGLLHPAAGHGVRHVSVGTDIDPKALEGTAIPNGAHPSKLFPPQQPLLRHTAEADSPKVYALSPLPALRSVRSRCRGHAGTRRRLGLRALLHCRVRCVLLALPPTVRPMLPWAFVQLRTGVCRLRCSRCSAPKGRAPRTAGICRAPRPEGRGARRVSLVWRAGSAPSEEGASPTRGPLAVSRRRPSGDPPALPASGWRERALRWGLRRVPVGVSEESPRRAASDSAPEGVVSSARCSLPRERAAAFGRIRRSDRRNQTKHGSFPSVAMCRLRRGSAPPAEARGVSRSRNPGCSPPAPKCRGPCATEATPGAQSAEAAWTFTAGRHRGVGPPTEAGGALRPPRRESSEPGSPCVAPAEAGLSPGPPPCSVTRRWPRLEAR